MIPQTQPEDPRDRAGRTLLALLESLGAVVGTIGITLILTIPVFLVPMYFSDEGSRARSSTSYESDFRVTKAREGEATLEELAEAIGRIEGVQAAEVSRADGDDDGGETGLTVLTSAPFPVFREEIEEILSAGGYSAGAPATRTVPGLMAWLKDPKALRNMLPAALTVQAVVFLAVGGLMMRFRVRREPGRVIHGPVRSLAWGLAGGVTAFVVSIIVSWLMMRLGAPIQEQEWLAEILGDRGVLLTLSPWIVLLVPIAEEVFFRGYIFRFVWQRAGWPVGLVASGLLFALVHFNLSGTLVYALVGVVFAIAYTRAGSLLAPVFAHMVYNGLVLVAALILAPG